METNRIYNEDCLVTLAGMPSNFLDLTITSPPYNVNLGKNRFNKKGYDVHEDNLSHEEYMGWLDGIFAQIYHKTKSGGRCAINVGDGKNGRISTHSDIIQRMKTIGWLPFTTIIWNKMHTSNRTAWGSYQSPSCPSFPSAFEYILVFAKDDLKLQTKGETDLTKEEFAKWAFGMWDFKGVSKKENSHPAPFPVELPLRLIKMLTWQDAVVYDPFMGSGTTAVACMKMGRKYVGSEVSKDYFDESILRLEKTQLNKSILHIEKVLKQRLPKIETAFAKEQLHKACLRFQKGYLERKNLNK